MQENLKVRLTRGCEADFDRLFEFDFKRELDRDGGDLTLAEQAVAAMRSGIATLKNSPFTCRTRSGHQATSHGSKSKMHRMLSSSLYVSSSRMTTTELCRLNTHRVLGT